jgi:hypothetical protein
LPKSAGSLIRDEGRGIAMETAFGWSEVDTPTPFAPAPAAAPAVPTVPARLVPALQRYVVVDTGALGLNIRRTPALVVGNVIGVAFDGDLLTATGQSATGDGHRWLTVREQSRGDVVALLKPGATQGYPGYMLFTRPGLWKMSVKRGDEGLGSVGLQVVEF